MSRDPGVPYGSGPEQAAADAEPTADEQTVTSGATPQGGASAAVPPTAPAGATSAPPGGGQPLAIPGIPLDRPELHVAAAFAGGFVLASVLKRLAR